MSIANDITKLSLSAKIWLYVVDATALGAPSVDRFHNGTNGLKTSVVWQGETYQYFPIQAEGFEARGTGALPRPTVQASNVLGLLGAHARMYDRLLGAKFIRKATHVRYLDAVNFPARRNLLTYTQAVDGAGWTKRGTASVTSTNGADPFGTFTADTLVGLDATVTGDIYQQVSGLVSGSRYEPSVWVNKISTSGTLQIRNTEGAAYGNWLIDLATLPPGWSRIVRENPAVRVVSEFVANNGVVGVGVQRGAGTGTLSVKVCGFQLVEGAATVDYQPVIGSTFNRNPDADPTMGYEDDTWIFDRVTRMDNLVAAWELVSPMALDGVMLPRGQVQGVCCMWAYRSGECGYVGGPVATKFDVATSDPLQDDCSLQPSGCKLRFGENAELPMRIFPAVGLMRQA